MAAKGKIVRVVGPVVEANGMAETQINEVVRVGNEKLIGEVIRLNADVATIQVYEETAGLKPGEPVEATGNALSVELGPGLLESIYDGIQRPLELLKAESGDFIARGIQVSPLDKKKKWHFKPVVKNGEEVSEGMVLGEVQETSVIKHKVLVPHGLKGKVSGLKEGEYTIEETICKVNSTSVIMLQKWPVKKARPFKNKLAPSVPLISGQRVLDFFFPIPKGAAAAIPGPFGAGKCVAGETLVLANNGLIPIKEVFEKEFSAKENRISGNSFETIIELNNPLKVYTFSGDKIEETIATHLYKGKTNKSIEIKTRSGKKVKLTPIHKLFKLNEKFEVIETEARNLRKGDFIISPRKIPFKEKYQKIPINFTARIFDEPAINSMVSEIKNHCEKNNLTLKKFAEKINAKETDLLNYYHKRNKPSIDFFNEVCEITGKKIPFSNIKTERQSKPIKIPECFDEEFAEFLGYLMGDGMIKGKRSVEFFNKKTELRKRFSFLLKKLFGLNSKEYYANTVEAVNVASVPLINLLSTEFNFPLKKKSNNLVLPMQLLVSPNTVAKAFINAYISCDGHIGKTELEITTASKKMQSGLSYLLAKLGILYRCSEKTVKGKKYFRVFISPREANKLSKYYEKKHYFNSSDIVPMTPELFKEILGSIKPWQLQKQGIPTTSFYANANQTTHTFQAVIESLGIQGHLLEFAQALEYVYCDKIIEVNESNKETDVYDLTVPLTHNFVSGNHPMVLHNTVTQQQLAKWVDADIIVYIGCGERGNEMTDVLVEFPELKDPKTGKPLMKRTVLIANTSNMPVAAREASIYTGITIAEYYRDMGYDVALMADSTSRWAEALREISGRLEEMPGEEGYPAYLGTRLASFYERAGRIESIGGLNGSVSVIGAVSPPGGDFSEPVTQNTLRITKVFWALDASLASRRHFPSINWLNSYSLYLDDVDPWLTENIDKEWSALRTDAMNLLQREAKLNEIVQIVGPDALSDKEKIILDVARMIREDFLQQNAYDAVDTYCSLQKQAGIMKLILKVYSKSMALNKTSSEKINNLSCIASIAKLKYVPEEKFKSEFDSLMKKMDSEFESLSKNNKEAKK
ncbi:MAG: V-type ATP synthase subunit A [Candidatus Diapherotrites archaeon]